MAATPDTGRFGVPGSSAPGTPAERKDSKVLMDALAARKDVLGAAAQIPAEDRVLSERILDEARQRSEQISAGRNNAATSRTIARNERIPPWLWLAWGVAIVAAIIAFAYFT